MGRLSELLSSSYWRIWLVTVLPTSLVFIGAALLVRADSERRVVQMAIDHGVPPESAIAPVLVHFQILAGALVATVLATVLTAWFVRRRIVAPFEQVSRLAGEMARGDFTVRANVEPGHGRIYSQMASSINALAESMERTERLRRELVANTAHEIRTPLTNIQGYLEALRDGVIDPNQEALDSLYEEVMRLVRLVDALHQLARADALRQQRFVTSLTDLDTLAEQLIRVIRPSAENRGIRFFPDLGARRMPVAVHADSIAQVMRNLLKNAVQYTPEGGLIRVQTIHTQGVYRFTCLNTGAGIPPEDMPFIFTRFYRTERARQGTGGVGIGLAICKELIEAHGGRIGAESKAGWTTVWFELPADQELRLEVAN